MAIYVCKDNGEFITDGRQSGNDWKSFTKTTLGKYLINHTVQEIWKSPDVFGFPPDLKDEGEDLHGNSDTVFKDSGHARNVVGFLSDGENELRFVSRFANTDIEDINHGDAFINYIMHRVFRLNLSKAYKTSSDCSRPLFEISVAAFPDDLNQALRQGPYRQRVRKECNGSKPRGAINIDKQIKFNAGKSNLIAYNTRDREEDNPVMQLIRHTVEYLKTNGQLNIWNLDSQLIQNVAKIENCTPSYNPWKRDDILRYNRTHPVTGMQYSAYWNLQQLCISILNKRKVGFAGKDRKVFGSLIDVAWLWEEYLSLLIENDFHHTRNKLRDKKKAANASSQLFICPVNPWKKKSSIPNQAVGEHYPDFISCGNMAGVSSGKCAIADAKYKDGISGSRDYQQILSYMLRYETANGIFIAPMLKLPSCKDRLFAKDDIMQALNDKDWMPGVEWFKVLRGSTFDGKAYENNEITQDENSVFIIHFRIPVYDETNKTSEQAWDAYVSNMKRSEFYFTRRMHWFCKHGGTPCVYQPYREG
ncbi:5-methylcytosine restriction system specificity protein McrC [Bifidobacterium oedipodis]|uniref:3-isopropylmalate dehydrogenase n=1 Tax=Bifidobacterium oedipodis TaxID=2675322 RepID=A0A7Y0HUL8_9BIFI|nr:hypothetical protein [Bifidobacterium sp. DSM 109957]NMM94894.1 3-isopropylmalate dehydrogenase [Bifidobacterium sp. DSM 109957]